MRKVLSILILIAIALSVSPNVLAQSDTFIFDGRNFAGTRFTEYPGGVPSDFIVADETICMNIIWDIGLFWDVNPHTLEFYFVDWRTRIPIDGQLHTIVVPPTPQSATFAFQLIAKPVYGVSLGDLINGYQFTNNITADWPRAGGMSFNSVSHSRCTSSQTTAASPQYFNPGDGRVNGAPGDRIAVYCNPAESLEVWGIVDSQGFPLAVFEREALMIAGLRGVEKDAGSNGKVSASVDTQGNFWVAWNSEAHGANGQGDFAKDGVCVFEPLPAEPWWEWTLRSGWSVVSWLTEKGAEFLAGFYQLGPAWDSLQASLQIKKAADVGEQLNYNKNPQYVAALIDEAYNNYDGKNVNFRARVDEGVALATGGNIISWNELSNEQKRDPAILDLVVMSAGGGYSSGYLAPTFMRLWLE